MATIIERLTEATGRIEAVMGASEVPSATAVDDEALLAGLHAVTDARRALDVVAAALSAEIERRSKRELGYSGLAQRTGHRTATTLIQTVTGQTAVEVRKATDAGRDLIAGVIAPQARGDAPPPEPWFAPLTRALGDGALSRDQFDAIRRGLGEPPIDRYPHDDPDRLREGWREAAVILIEEAADRVVEDLRAAARLARDTLDPLGTQLRFEERFERRSFTMWVDENGQHCARIRFDDDGAAWARTLLNAALRPRRGPRFVAPADGAPAEPDADRRTNEQLQYDRILAVLKTGAQADPAQAFGDRQPGVRIVVSRDDLERERGVGYYEETGQAAPAGVVETYLCDAGVLPVIVDGQGSPLDVGREKRLFTRRQRIAMAIRDGGCLDCGAEPSRCEAHHLDHWHEHHGRTDTADGVLLCRNCHMRLHNLGFRIIRDEFGYWLHPPAGSEEKPRLLRPRSLLRFTGLARSPVRGADQVVRAGPARDRANRVEPARVGPTGGESARGQMGADEPARDQVVGGNLVTDEAVGATRAQGQTKVVALTRDQLMADDPARDQMVTGERAADVPIGVEPARGQPMGAAPPETVIPPSAGIWTRSTLGRPT
ncbi:HNH endonuclease [Microbacterium sp. B2969]|uniref:HNH endonuclease n=1 Tax=Microbacterium alkaliflavum TaxID=3248839 RepID=A0ABW7Q9C8_9MICO